ncbi:MAG: hypothetical protein AB7F23_09320 [Phycisphaerae bacterium]
MSNNINSKVDSIETVNVLNGVRIFFFVLTAVALLLNLTAIVLSATGRIDRKYPCSSVCENAGKKQLPACPEEAVPEVPEVPAAPAGEADVKQAQETPAAAEEEMPAVSSELQKEAEEALASAEQEYVEVEQPVAEVYEPAAKPVKKISPMVVSLFVRLANVAALFGIVMFLLTSSFTACVSLCANLGGLSRITRATVKSLAALIIFLPWQLVFGRHVVAGAMFMPNELGILQNLGDMPGWHTVFIFARFLVPWLIVALLMLSAMADSIAWKRRVSKRIGLISE